MAKNESGVCELVGYGIVHRKNVCTIGHPVFGTTSFEKQGHVS